MWDFWKQEYYLIYIHKAACGSVVWNKLVRNASRRASISGPRGPWNSSYWNLCLWMHEMKENTTKFKFFIVNCFICTWSNHSHVHNILLVLKVMMIWYPWHKFTWCKSCTFSTLSKTVHFFLAYQTWLDSLWGLLICLNNTFTKCFTVSKEQFVWSHL